MDDLCIHCGTPVVDEHSPLGRVLVHTRTAPGSTAYQLCPDGSGHVACLPQGGVE